MSEDLNREALIERLTGIYGVLEIEFEPEKLATAKPEYLQKEIARLSGTASKMVDLIDAKIEKPPDQSTATPAEPIKELIIQCRDRSAHTDHLCHDTRNRMGELTKQGIALIFGEGTDGKWHSRSFAIKNAGGARSFYGGTSEVLAMIKKLCEERNVSDPSYFEFIDQAEFDRRQRSAGMLEKAKKLIGQAVLNPQDKDLADLIEHAASVFDKKGLSSLTVLSGPISASNVY